MKLALVIGHEFLKQGAHGKEPLNCSEYQYNSEIAVLAYREARDRGHQCKVFTRDVIGVTGAYKQVNEWEPDVCIELHFNACDGRVQGTETLVGSDNDSDFAELVQMEMASVFERKGKQNRGVKIVRPGERGGTNVSLAHCPSCLVEPFFGDNAQDATLGNRLRIPYAMALVRAAERFMEIHNGSVAHT